MIFAFWSPENLVHQTGETVGGAGPGQGEEEGEHGEGHGDGGAGAGRLGTGCPGSCSWLH